MSSLFEGESKLSHTVREFSTDLNRGPMDSSKLRRLKADLLNSAGYALRMIAMIESESDTTAKRPRTSGERPVQTDLMPVRPDL